MTDYSNQDISGLNLSGVNLTGANFTNTNATNVNFTNAIITNAIFKNTLITGANISTLVFSDIQKGHLLLRAANHTITSVNNLTALTPAQFRIIQPAVSLDTINMIQTVTVKIPNTLSNGNYTIVLSPLISELVCIFVATNQNITIATSSGNIRTIRSNGTVIQDVDNANATLNLLKVGSISYSLTAANGDGVIAMVPINFNVYQVNGTGLGDVITLTLGNGATGSTGIGSTGPTGPGGAVGAAGVAGSTGPTGPGGVAGAAGVAGSTGPTGAAGVAGAAGAAGVAGAAGSTGPTGPGGVAGAAGVAGVAGSTGPTGPGGAAGAAGVAGAAGSTGPTGAAGVAGAPGAAGAAGSTGPTGPGGAAGAAGSAGVAGSTGPTGPLGSGGTTPATKVALSYTSGTAVNAVVFNFASVNLLTSKIVGTAILYVNSNWDYGCMRFNGQGAYTTTNNINEQSYNIGTFYTDPATNGGGVGINYQDRSIIVTNITLNTGNFWVCIDFEIDCLRQTNNVVVAQMVCRGRWNVINKTVGSPASYRAYANFERTNDLTSINSIEFGDYTQNTSAKSIIYASLNMDVIQLPSFTTVAAS